MHFSTTYCFVIKELCRKTSLGGACIVETVAMLWRRLWLGYSRVFCHVCVRPERIQLWKPRKGHRYQFTWQCVVMMSRHNSEGSLRSKAVRTLQLLLRKMSEKTAPTSMPWKYCHPTTWIIRHPKMHLYTCLTATNESSSGAVYIEPYQTLG